MIRVYDQGLEKACREFLNDSPQADYCHDPGWLSVIREAYDKETFMFVRTHPVSGEIRGLAPACYLASAGFGKSLVCLPYLDYGGILAEDLESEDLLRDKLLAEARYRRAGLEIHSRAPLSGLSAPQDDEVSMILPLGGEEFFMGETDWGGLPAEPFLDGLPSPFPYAAAIRYPESQPVALRGPDSAYIGSGAHAGNGAHGGTSADGFWKNLDAKVRNQIRKAEKSGVTVVWGREDRLDEFYRVFCVNMRDVGSPTHSRGFFEAVLRHFPGAQIGTAHRQGKCIGGLFRILWKNELIIPWASTLRDERIHCSNYALYWESIRFAIEEGCERVDMGRSTRDEGAYRFKKHWQAQELPLYRYQFDEKGHFLEQSWHISQGKLGWTRNIWAKLPLKVANTLGPILRGSISA